MGLIGKCHTDIVGLIGKCHTDIVGLIGSYIEIVGFQLYNTFLAN
jgi:hypothetical protein